MCIFNMKIKFCLRTNWIKARILTSSRLMCMDKALALKRNIQNFWI
jgi:hypothetical protein